MTVVPPPRDPSPRSLHLLRDLRRIYDRRETIRFLTLSELKAGHRDRVLGHLWSILDPLFFMLVYFFVFGVLFRAMLGSRRPIDFMLYLFAGILVFRFVEGTASLATNCIRSNRGIIHEIAFPKAVFPIAITLSRLYDFCWGLVVFVTSLLLAHVWPTVNYLWMPLLLVITLIFAAGAALFVASLGAFFADTSNIVTVAMRFLFYVSPVFYFVRDRGGHPAQLHNEVVRFWYLKNPVACLMECYRDALLWGVPPQTSLLVYAAAFALVFWIVGFMVFSATEGHFAKYV